MRNYMNKYKYEGDSKIDSAEGGACVIRIPSLDARHAIRSESNTLSAVDGEGSGWSQRTFS